MVLLQKVVKSRNRLPKAVVTATICWSSQGVLGWYSQKYGLIFGWCCVEPGFGLSDLMDPFQLKISYDFVITVARLALVV